MTEEISQSEHNKQFLDRLEAGRPDLLDHVEMKTDEGGEYILIRILPPEGQDDAIVISTKGQELTMFYHAIHDHFDIWHVGDDGDEQDVFDMFFDYIDAFMEEELVAISVFDGEQWCRSHAAIANEPVEPKENRQVIVRSWKGTYSRTIE